jgi:hypothetical protein
MLGALALVCLSTLAQPDPGAAPDLRTVAEKTDFRATARHADVVQLLDDLAASRPDLTARLSLGKSVEGRELPLLVLSSPRVENAREARALAKDRGKLIVLLIGNIHAGEVCGKEALPILARELLAQLHPALLEHLIIALAPIYNADGNERVAKDNRPGQNGPEDGMGIRHNAHDRDLNRDFVKLEEPETNALVRFLNDWDPEVFVDTHTTNGSYHRYLISYAGPKVPAGDAHLITWCREAFFPAVGLIHQLRNQTPAFWYGSFEGAFSPADPSKDPLAHTRWETFPAEPRYGTNYVGLRNRVSVLCEAYSHAPFKDRVLATRDFCRSVLELSAENTKLIQDLTRAADQRAITNTSIVLRTRVAPFPEKVKIQGFREELTDGRIVSTGEPTEHEVELWDRFEPVLTVTRPKGYLLPAPRTPESVKAHAKILATLANHGVPFVSFKEPRRLAAEKFTITKATPASREFQGHVLVSLDAQTTPITLTTEADDLYIETNQPLGNLIAYLLEPMSEDGLGAWNFYDHWIQELPASLPLYRVMQEPR